MKRTLLIATTNKGKLKEIQYGLESLPFIECVGLSDIKKEIEVPEENEHTLHANAFLKASYYANATSMFTLADDTGLFINGLNGWPGVNSARIAHTDEQRIDSILEKMRDLPNRAAEFRITLAMYDPENQTSFTCSAKKEGVILDAPIAEENALVNFGYTRLFYIPEAKKTFAQMDTREKNTYSHRGKCIQEVKYYLQNTFGAKHVVVPVACIIKDAKILMSLRNDPYNPSYHQKWEFPGGCVEFKESIEENLVREVKEEVGYDVEPVKRLSYIHVRSRESKTHQYQVYLLPYVCKIIGGEKQHINSETLDSRWFNLKEVLEYDLLADNRQIFAIISEELQSVIEAHNL